VTVFLLQLVNQLDNEQQKSLAICFASVDREIALTLIGDRHDHIDAIKSLRTSYNSMRISANPSSTSRVSRLEYSFINIDETLFSFEKLNVLRSSKLSFELVLGQIMVSRNLLYSLKAEKKFFFQIFSNPECRDSES
jgi:hypothetical protein